MAKIPFYIVTGWLGSGKTTLLKNILNGYGDKTRIAIIQNEFAPTGMDGKELKNTGQPFQLLEINNGSVFCVCQLDNFKTLLEKLSSDYNPEVIFLESSGLADPISIAEILEAPEVVGKITLQKIYTVIDAVNFDRTFQMMTRFKHQVMVADKLIINKTDFPDINTDLIEEKIKAWNPFAEIVKTSYCKIGLNDLFEVNNSDVNRKLPVGKSGGRPDMGISLLRLHEKISNENLVKFIDSIKSECQRIKGFVNTDKDETIAVQAVYDHVEFKHMNRYDGRTELIIFSDRFSPRELTKKFKSMAVND